jgi:uncharacterized RDD family membrane protein YckC
MSGPETPHCSNCGAPLTESVRFCEQCGRPIEQTTIANEDDRHSVAAGDQTQLAAPRTGVADWPSPDELAAPLLAPFGAVLSGWWRRVGALLIDSLILLVPGIVIVVLANHLFGRMHIDVIAGTPVHVRSLTGVGLAGTYLLLAVIGGAYFTLLNGLGSGQTPGNRACSIAIRDIRTGTCIGVGRSLLRWFVRTALYLLLVLPGLVNDLFPLWDRRHQTLADKAARSVVIRLR